MASVPVGKRRVGARTLRWLIALLVLLALGILTFELVAFFAPLRNDNPGCETPQRSSGCTRVLFIGNSYTAVNNLPIMFANLAWSGGHRVETGVQAPGGWSLTDHAVSQDTVTALSSKEWDIVVLQEQSEIPSVESQRQALMYPAARQLVLMARNAGAKPIFFVTWAHRAGWPENGMPDYFSMQRSIDSGYLAIAGEQHAIVAPVGFAWMALVTQSVPGLWQDDGSHPTTLGTYLAASVFYSTIFFHSPAGLKYHANLSDDDAANMQGVAASTVFGDPSKWGLP